MARLPKIAVCLLVASACVQPAPRAFDAEDLRAIALPKGDFGAEYASFSFDWSFAGFESNEERARDKSASPDDERRDLSQFQRLAAYQEMYVPPDGPPLSPVARIFSLVALFRDAAGASGYLGAQSTRAGATRFDVGSIGEQSAGYRSQAGPESLTRVQVRRGVLLGTIGINRRDQSDASGEAIALARKLDDRMRRALEGSLRGYHGASGSELGTERLELMTLAKPDLGGQYAAFEDELFSTGFQDNEERSQTFSLDGTAELADYTARGRVTGFFNAFRPERGVGYVSTGAHLFSKAAGAEAFTNGFIEREKRLAGQALGDTRVEAVSGGSVSGVGVQASTVSYRFLDASRVTVVFRRGRVVGEVHLIRRDADGLDAEAIALAGKLDDRIQAVLDSQIKP